MLFLAARLHRSAESCQECTVPVDLCSSQVPQAAACHGGSLSIRSHREAAGTSGSQTRYRPVLGRINLPRCVSRNSEGSGSVLTAENGEKKRAEVEQAGEEMKEVLAWRKGGVVEDTDNRGPRAALYIWLYIHIVT